MAQVTVPHEFFQGELQVYGDWREAFARELVQNALDANPETITITTGNENGRAHVTFSDDGHGMSRDTLENVFFALGRTTKTGGDSIGGFGRARIILCFAQHSYRIHTGRVLASGQGGEYSITDSGYYRQGCELTIETVDDTDQDLRTAFFEVLGSSQLPVPVNFNGQIFPATERPGRATRILRDEEGRAWSRIYVAEGNGRQLVRVSGLSMFYTYPLRSDNVTIEIVPSRSRQVLSASRDRLRPAYSRQLDDFIRDMLGNRRKAMKPDVEPLNVLVPGSIVNPALPEPSPSASPYADVAAYIPRPALGPSGIAGTTTDGHHVEVDASGRSSVAFDVYLHADADTRKNRRLARQWNPAAWPTNSHGTGSRRRALIVTWREAVACAMELLAQRAPGERQIQWNVGVLFDGETRACHMETAGGTHVLSLNPVTDTGAMLYRVGDDSSLRTLLALALHEVCHIMHKWHDEGFSTLLTDMMSDIDQKAALRRMRLSRTTGR